MSIFTHTLSNSRYSLCCQENVLALVIKLYIGYNTTMGIPYIPYFQTTRYRVKAMVDLAEIKPAEKVADLGSGDGRIAIAFAHKGALLDAYELDDQLLALAKENASKENVEINFLKEDFWDKDLSQYAIICCYPMPDIMEKLEEKLQNELAPGSRVLLNYYPFPNWKPAIIKDNIYLYVK